MTVVTICRQVGCEGRYIAEGLAKALGYHLTDYSTVENILKEYGLIEFPEVYNSPATFWEYFTNIGPARGSISIMQPKVNFALAQHGDVVMLGRGLFASLQNLTDVINVRVKASLDTRIRRVIRDQGFTERHAAEEFIKERDLRVAGYTKEWYGVSVDDLTMFDLVIDTSKVDPDLAIAWIADAVRALKHNRKEGATTADLEVDPVVAQVVADQFR